MSKGLSIHDGTGMIARDPSRGILHSYGTVVPSGMGYAPGSIFLRISGASIGLTLYVNIGTFAVANFVELGMSGAVCVPFIYGEATALDAAFFTADRQYIIKSLICRPLVAGTDAGAVTAQIRKAASGVAIASGTAVHTGTINLKGTIDTNQVLTLAATGVITIASGSSLGLDVTGVTTAARGVITAILLPL